MSLNAEHAQQKPLLCVTTQTQDSSNSQLHKATVHRLQVYGDKEYTSVPWGFLAETRQGLWSACVPLLTGVLANRIYYSEQRSYAAQMWAVGGAMTGNLGKDEKTSSVCVSPCAKSTPVMQCVSLVG